LSSPKTSSDGQKFEVRSEFLHGNDSFKYFGKEQGVAAYTFRDERDLLWHSTVSGRLSRRAPSPRRQVPDPWARRSSSHAVQAWFA
jgi:hypothetical protein